ncbi:hypothetical protein [Parasitella parasitica]|uniref:Alpha-methylacyl-CoA racemase n=1 Tax=Parasitella parasitica TaxID=35722 RepID=A0A0B7NFC2_9FUNG|nr:hypothetical protein [Parasitella parasitica]
MGLPLDHITVFEMAGLAPAPFAGLVMADFGANVIRIDRSKGFSTDVLTRNKRSIALDLKNPAAIKTLLELFKTADVLLDPFRPGVMEKLGLGPDVLLKQNPRLIYARLSGFGQSGPRSHVAGHDINYLAISGVLSLIGRQGENPFFPVNILADFAGGGLMCVMGILMALIERSKSGKGQIIDANLTAGSSYLATFPYLMQKYGLVWEGERGSNMLDGGAHFYETYRTKDDQFMAVGAIEPQFYAVLLEKLNLSNDDSLPGQLDKEAWPDMKKRFQSIFASKTQHEWCLIFDGSDACVTPVLSYNNANRKADAPSPAPHLSRTPAKKSVCSNDGDPPFLNVGKNSIEVLQEFGIGAEQIEKLLRSNALVDSSDSNKYNKDSSIGEKKQISTTDKWIPSPYKITDLSVKTRIIAYGNASFGTSINEKIPAPTKQIAEAVKKLSKDPKGTYFIHVDEYLTSQTCKKCKQQNLQTSTPPNQSVKYMLRNFCNTVNCDVMASKNIHYILHYMSQYDNKRPLEFARHSDTTKV